MITAIREIRRARGMTLEEVARACDPPTTAQTIGRLETGTRTVSLAWLARIARALGVESADLVRLPDRATLPLAVLLDATGPRAPRREANVAPPVPTPGAVAIQVVAGVGDYRAGDILWLDLLDPARFADAIGHDVLAPLPAGRFAFGRLLTLGPPTLRPPGPAAPPRTLDPPPAWLARAARLVRDL